jgi:asparagine synthase (glutamine-hydrolysing)
MIDNLYDHRFSYSEEEQCEIYLKGNPFFAGEERDISTWLKTLASLLSRDESSFRSELLADLRKLSGLFCLIIRKDELTYIAVDRIRAIPFFYGFREDELFMTSNLHKYQEKNGVLECDNDKLEEFISATAVLGKGTVFKNVYGLQAGELVCINGREISSERYFEFRPVEKPGLMDDRASFYRAFDQSLLSVFSNMLKHSPDVNRWLVPLSGGHDSRVIANYLYRLGQKNVICYTYGNPGNEQSRISRQVAEALGYEWHFVEYTEQKWNMLQELGMIGDYIDNAFNGVSTTHLQDFLAIHELKEKGIFKKGDVFVPGHTFDWLAGSNFSHLDMACTDKKTAVERTVLKHLKSRDWSGAPIKAVEDLYDRAGVEPKYFQEYFNWQERRSKFMVNCVRGYEFFGFDYRLPYWEKEIVEFCQMLPDEERMNRRAFFEAVENGILVDQLLAVPYAGKVDNSGRSMLSQLMSKYLSGFIKTQILRLTNRKVKMNEGLNQIYAVMATSVKEILDPVEDFPEQVLKYFDSFLDRYPYQVDYHFLTLLYSIRRQLDKKRTQARSFRR